MHSPRIGLADRQGLPVQQRRRSCTRQEKDYLALSLENNDNVVAGRAHLLDANKVNTVMKGEQ